MIPILLFESIMHDHMSFPPFFLLSLTDTFPSQLHVLFFCFLSLTEFTQCFLLCAVYNLLLEHLRHGSPKEKALTSASSHQMPGAPLVGVGHHEHFPTCDRNWLCAKHCHVQPILLEEAGILSSQGGLHQNSTFVS